MTVVCIPVSASAAGKKTVRYTVLVLDTSNEAGFLDSNWQPLYTARTAIEYVKTASEKFLEDISGVKGKNYVAVVNFQATANILSDFTLDTDSLREKINALQPQDDIRDISDGLVKANTLLNSVTDPNAIKNVVLFTTGLTNNGSSSYTGWYDKNTVGSDWYRINTGVKLYAYANIAIEKSNILKENDVTVYTIGLFQTMDGMPSEGLDIAEFFRITTRDLASSIDTYYEVEDVNKLEFAFTDIANEILDTSSELEPIDVNFGKDGHLIAYYDDSLFAGPASEMDTSLAAISTAFSMSAFNSADPSHGYRNAEEFLKNEVTDFTDISYNSWFATTPTEDSLGVIAGHKTVTLGSDEFTLVAVGVRGGECGSEAGSNFLLGGSGDHAGFNSAAQKVTAFIKDYIASNGITGPVKLWLTGYGRGGAAANIAGALIGSGSGLGTGVECSSDGIYVYCIASPTTTTSAGGYANIHNIIDPNDAATKLAPTGFGLGRYGSDYFLPSGAANYDDNVENTARMLSIYSGIGGVDEYSVSDFRMRTVSIDFDKEGDPSSVNVNVTPDKKDTRSLDTFLDEYVGLISSDIIGSRADYVSGYQSGLEKLYSALGSSGDSKLAGFRSKFASQLLSELSGIAATYDFKNTSGGRMFGSSTAATVTKIAGIFESAAKSTLGSSFDAASVSSSVGKLIAELFGAEPSYFATFLANSSIIAGTHSGAVCYSWLSAVDPVRFTLDEDYGDDDDEPKKTYDGDYRIVYINCDVDVTVTGADGRPVAAIVNEMPMKISQSSFACGVDNRGQKYAVIPSGSGYTLSIRARNDDTVSYSISEFSGSLGKVVRTVNYFNIELKKGQVLKGDIPAYAESDHKSGTGSKSAYKLVSPGGSVIAPDSDLSGSDVKYCTVRAVPSAEGRGIVSGSGRYSFGAFAELSAIPVAGYKFTGWYKGSTLVSKNDTYRFCVTADTDITAMFRPDYTVNVKAVASGKNVKLTWNADSTASGYEVYELFDGEYTLAASTKETEYSVEDLGTTERVFNVKAVYGEGEPEVSEDISVILPGLYIKSGSSIETFSGIDALTKRAASMKSSCEILIGESASTKALTLPSGAGEIRVKTLNSAVLTISGKSLSIPADTTWDAETSVSGLTVKGSAKLSLYVLKDLSVDNINTFAEVFVKNGRTLTVSKKANAIGRLSGTVKLAAGSSMAKVAFGSGELILTENAKRALPKVSVSDIAGTGSDALTVTVVNASGVTTIESGTAILYNEGKSSFADKIKVTNKDTDGDDLEAYAYGKEIKAECPAYLSLYDGTSFENYPSFTSAFATMQKSGNYEIALYDHSVANKFTLPSKFNTLVIDGSGYSLDLMGNTKFSTAFPISLRNITLIAKKDISIAASGNVELTNVYSTKSLSIKGNANSVISTTNVSVPDLSIDKFGTANINGRINIGKSLNVGTLYLDEMGVAALSANSSVTVNDLIGVYGSEIDIAKGNKKGITVKGTIKGKIILTGDAEVGKSQILSIKAKNLNLRKLFNIKGLYPDGSKDEYMLYQKGSKVTLEKTAFKIDSTPFCNWTDALKYIESKNHSTANYIVTLVSDHTEKSLKLPAASKYSSITFRSNGKTLTVKGQINLTRTTTFENIRIAGASSMKDPLGIILKDAEIDCPITTSTRLILSGSNKVKGTVSCKSVSSLEKSTLTIPRNCYLNVSLSGISGKLTLCIAEADGSLAPLPTGTVISQGFVGIYSSHLYIGNPGYYTIKRQNSTKKNQPPMLTLVYSSEPPEETEEEEEGSEDSYAIGEEDTAAGDFARSGRASVNESNTRYLDEVGDELSKEYTDDEVFGFGQIVTEEEAEDIAEDIAENTEA
ncbi:MAG: VWA domain-containing protein [Ruminiclostridium sp.]|nr:VWA domain-containing protein [Ruminiclostridium sp.]